MSLGSIRRTIFSTFFAAILVIFFMVNPAPAHAQATTSTGSIQGSIVDAKGGVVASAKVTVTNKGTGQVSTPAVSDSGVYISGSLKPG